MARKLDSLPQAQREKIETDLLAISVIYNERYGIASTRRKRNDRSPTTCSPTFINGWITIAVRNCAHFANRRLASLPTPLQ